MSASAKKIVVGLVCAAVLAGAALYFFNYGSDSARSPLDEGANKGAVEFQAITLREGSGDPAVNGDTVSVHYTGKLEDGQTFDSSLERGEPINFILGAGQVIRGWEIGVLGMKIGEKRRIVIPPELAYGEEGVPGVIPSNAVLVFEVELMAVEKK